MNIHERSGHSENASSTLPLNNEHRLHRAHEVSDISCPIKRPSPDWKPTLRLRAFGVIPHRATDRRERHLHNAGSGVVDVHPAAAPAAIFSEGETTLSIQQTGEVSELPLLRRDSHRSPAQAVGARFHTRLGKRP